MGFLIVLGALIFMITVINIIAVNPPLSIFISLNLLGEHNKLNTRETDNAGERSVFGDLQKEALLMELFNLLQSILFFIWFFYAGNLMKQNKVTVVIKLSKMFLILVSIYLILIVLEAVFGYKYMHTLYSQSKVQKIIEDDRKSWEDFKEISITCMEIVFFIYGISFVIVMFFYFQLLKAHKQSLVQFHEFLNNYRQTPRSRFIRKYSPI